MLLQRHLASFRSEFSYRKFGSSNIKMDTKFILAAIFAVILGAGAEYTSPCNHVIFCNSSLLHTVQMAHVFKDSKTFVDRPLRFSSEQVLANYEVFMRYHRDEPTNESVALFVEYNFEKEALEFEAWNASDWSPNPAFLSKIVDVDFRRFALALHNFWGELGRRINPKVEGNPDKYSIVYVPHGVIVPGGRFREFYYWDSYWIQAGLLKSEMYETVKGMILNFVYMVDNIGFVPNGGRVYYQRSQPPLLIPMVENYLKTGFEKDDAFLKQILPSLDAEFNFWVQNRSVNVTVDDVTWHTMFRYNSEKNGPRPESYREDYLLAESMNDDDKLEMYSALHSGAESGIDYSSRWFVKNIRSEDLIHTSTRSFVPADLNGYLYKNAVLMSEFHTKVGNTSAAAAYKKVAEDLKVAINQVLWNEELGCWFDYNFIDRALHKKFFPTNIVPLWAGAQVSDNVVVRVMEYLTTTTEAFSHPGGIPSSEDNTGEQWDFPNAWAPLQDLVIKALANSGHAEAQALAFKWAQIWVSTNYIAFYNSKTPLMYEKYNVTELGRPGGGGEYEIVIGFGWSNGVVLDFLNTYGDRMVAPPLTGGASWRNSLSFKIPIFLLMLLKLYWSN